MSGGIISLETEHYFVWTTEKPRIQLRRSSPVFTLQNSRYSLYLVLEMDQTYALYVMNAKGEAVFPRLWKTSVAIIYGTNACLIQRRQAYDTLYNPSIWRKYVADIRQAVPDFDRTEYLSLRISFDLGLEVSSVRPKIEKSVQTPSHLDNHSDLEALSLDFAKLLDGDSHHDVEIKCGRRGFKAHRYVLSARSKVFSAMLQSNMLEGNTGKVKIQDMEPEIFRHFLGYLYTGKLPELPVDVAKQLYEAGDKYAVEELKNRCSVLLRDSLKRESCCDILVLADQHNDKELKDAVIAYIMNENLPHCHDIWQEFCDNHPRICVEVLDYMYHYSK